MKTKSTSLLALAGLLAFGGLPVLAQEINPEPPPASGSAEPQRSPAEPRREAERERSHSRFLKDRREEVATAFMGVLTSPVPRELRAHFSIPEGFGLLVQEVMPDTPAQAAGLKEDDVLMRFEDQKLVNMEQLQTLVRSKKKGDVVSLTVITGGRESQVSVTIDERMVPARPEGPMDRNGWFSTDPDRSRDVRDYVERMQDQMREYQNRMREWRRENGRSPMPEPPSRHRSERRENHPGPDSRREEPGRGDRSSPPASSDRREASHVTRSDDSGIYILRRENGRSVFTARPKDGAEQSWNLNVEQERNAIPEPLKEKLKQLEEIRSSGAPGSTAAPSGSKPDGDL